MQSASSSCKDGFACHQERCICSQRSLTAVQALVVELRSQLQAAESHRFAAAEAQAILETELQRCQAAAAEESAAAAVQLQQVQADTEGVR